MPHIIASSNLLVLSKRLNSFFCAFFMSFFHQWLRLAILYLAITLKFAASLSDLSISPAKWQAVICA
ncbi:hypothetical protein, partial [Staphylococcus pasteuri_A]